MKKTTILCIAFFLFAISFSMAQGSWTPLVSGSSTTLTSVYFPTLDTGYVSVESGYVLKTNNGGQTWNNLGAGPMDELVFLNQWEGVGAGEGCILRTTVGGSSWDTVYSNPNVYQVMGIHFPDQANGFATALDQNMGTYVLKTSNGGSLWDTIYHIPFDITFCIFFTDAMNGFVGGTGYLYKTANGGSSWQKIAIDTINYVGIYDVHFPTTDTGYLTTDMDGIYKTTDGGATWAHIDYSIPPILYTVFFTDAYHGFTGGGNGFNAMTLYQTDDGGASWYQGASGVEFLLDLFFTDTATGYAVGSNGTILKYAYGSGINDDAAIESDLSIYPNPSSGNIRLQVTQDFGPIASIAVYNYFGALQVEQTGVADEIDLSALNGGMYFIMVRNAGGERIGGEVVRE